MHDFEIPPTLKAVARAGGLVAAVTVNATLDGVELGEVDR